MNARHRFLRLALITAARGHHAIPLRPGSKQPAWHGLDQCKRFGDCAAGHRGWEQRATREPAVIRRWWADRPLDGVGIATGPSGLYVVDLDPAHGEPAPAKWLGAQHGRDVLARLANEHGQPYPGDTFTVRTPSGGLHLYYAAPPGASLRNTNARVGWRIDSRGQGGFVVAPGNTTATGTYFVERNLPIAPLPVWLADLFRPPPLPPPSPVSGVRAPSPLAQAYLRKVADGVVAAAPKTAHRTLLAAAASLGSLLDTADLDESDVVAALLDAARLRRIPAREAANAVRDGITYGRRRPRALSADHQHERTSR